MRRTTSKGEGHKPSVKLEGLGDGRKEAVGMRSP